MTYDADSLRRWEAAAAPFARAAPRADPLRSALLVVDAQTYFADLCAPIAATLRATVAGCRARGVPVVFTQHGHADPEKDGGMLAQWWGDSILEGHEGHAFLPDLDVGPDDLLVRKRRYDAFHDTQLETLLREREVDDLAIAGVMTNLCVETTARSAFVRDFRVRILMDATATVSEAMHVSSLVNLAYGFAHVQTSASWLEALHRAGT